MNQKREKMNSNPIGVAPLGDPHFEGNTKKTPKTCLNLTSHFSHLTSRNRGITLIALIITIIVMLILVGVTVNVAINEGLFTIAKKATTQTQKSIDAEQLQTVALGTIDMNTGKIDLEKLQKELSNWKIDRDNRQCTSPNGNKFIIDDYGSVEEIIWEQLEDGTITNGEVTLQVGDYVNYEELVKTTTINTNQITSDLQTYSGYTGSTYSTTYPLNKEDTLKWRVLDEKNGRLRLISEKPTTSTVFLRGYNGYNNAVYLLDNVCNTLYSTSKGIAQNLKIEDIQDKIDKTKFDYTQFKNDIVKYGETKEYTENIYYPEIFEKEKTGWVDGNKGTEYNLSEQDVLINQTGLKQAKVRINTTQTRWNRIMQESDWKNKTYQNIFIKDINNPTTNYDTYWLSSRCVATHSDSVSFRVFYCWNVYGSVDACSIYGSNMGITGYPYSVRPVITLSSDIQIEDKVNNTWQIK